MSWAFAQSIINKDPALIFDILLANPTKEGIPKAFESIAT